MGISLTTIQSTVLISFREWLHSYHQGSCAPLVPFFIYVLISFREWLHSYIRDADGKIVGVPGCSHLFQRVASFLLVSLSLSMAFSTGLVLISFREWLHSYWQVPCARRHMKNLSSHLFQRVASFLQVFSSQRKQRNSSGFSSLSESGFIPT